MTLPILKTLKDPVKLFVFLGVSFLVFDVSYYFMAFTLGTRDNMCLIGAGLTPLNVAFSLIISLLSGLIVAGIMGVWNSRCDKAIPTSGGFLGLILGGMTVFCPLCTIPVISLFGLSISLSFFTTYAMYFKVIALILMLIAAHRLNKQLSGKLSCKV